jgi:hypothetical protein
MSTETATQKIARAPYTTEDGTPERRLEVKARLAAIQVQKDAEVDTIQPVTGSTITPRDFSHRTTDKDRDEWTAGKMRHVIAALEGRRCVVTVEARTGFTLIGARLKGIRRTPGYGTYQVLVFWEYAPGEFNRTWYPLNGFGAAITAMDAPLHFTAVELARVESSAAIKAAREALPECTYGSWETTPGADYVIVRFTPQKADGGPETALFMDVTPDGFRPGKRYSYTGCGKA